MRELKTQTRSFDLTPHPRILPMLGEISLSQWRCLAELVDNSIDAFLEAERAGKPIPHPEVHITTPITSTPNAQITVRDNGIGMDAETLERAARAGWTSHDPINNLGLFGMGFNIATARLGTKTTIWTSRLGDAEEVGLEIDFEKLANKKAFNTPMLVRPKGDQNRSGTSIVVENIKPDQREWFCKNQNRSQVTRQLGRIYSAMLSPSGSPIGFKLHINGYQVTARRHCIWGGPGDTRRSVETARFGTVESFQPINATLGTRPFCTRCWNWLGAGQESCPQCALDGQIVMRDRRVHGWLGIQRYLDTEDYGIDFLRNGRKIEVGNKELFYWKDPVTEKEEKEYPLDDIRLGGRIVGEIHLDHCRVPYTKDRFVREDVAWFEMVHLIRGDGPLRPELARSMGKAENQSPLYRLFQAYRRATPHNKNAGGWTKRLAIPDNDIAIQMAERFAAGETDYLTDAKWWELAEEADADVLVGTGGENETTTLGGAVPSPADSSTSSAPTTTQPPPPRTPILHLTNVYHDEVTGLRFDVRAFAIQQTDPCLADEKSPWAIKKTTSGQWEFLVVLSDPVFRSATMTPLDALVCQLAWQAVDLYREQGQSATFSRILASLRDKYIAKSKLEPTALTAEAQARLTEIARSVIGRVPPDDVRSFFENCGPSAQERIRLTMAQRNATNPQGALADGRFLQYAPADTIAEFVLSQPEHFFDGKYWDDTYFELNFGSEVANDEARKRITSYYRSLLTDVVWLAQQGDEIGSFSRERLLRASLATALLAPTAQSLA